MKHVHKVSKKSQVGCLQLPVSSYQKTSVTNIAKKYRDETDRHDGVVIVFDGEASGWMNELRNPEGWMPGCIAVDSQGRHFRAVGGNDYDGAKNWKEIV